MFEIHNNSFRDLEWPKSDLIITSPPYKVDDEYSDALMQRFLFRAFNSLCDDRWLFLNFGHLAGNKSRPFRVAMLAERLGFHWVDTITWLKNHYRPLQGNKRPNNLTEFIFMLGKGNPTLDRLSIGVPYADKSNAKRWKGAKGKDCKCRGNLWHIPYETVKRKAEKLHNDRFPVALPEMCIKFSGIQKGSLVIDPFLGSGSTAMACKNLGMGFWGAEIDPIHYEIAKKRLTVD